MSLDLPAWKQYLNFVRGPDLIGAGHPSGVLNWPANLGYSFYNQQPVLQTILDRVPMSASLALGGRVLWLLLGFSTGILAALRPRSRYDRAAMGLALFGVSAPVFLIGLGLAVRLLLQARLSAHARLRAAVPRPGGVGHAPGSGLDHRGHYVCRLYTRMLRAGMLEVADEDYIHTARAKGLSERRVVLRHLVRASVTPVVTMLGFDLGGLLGGVIVVEHMFGLPGLGAATVQTIGDNDLPMVQGVVLFGPDPF
jgi:peptide/nickel transport system permease protein